MRATIDIDTFKWRLAETIAWCKKRVTIADAKQSLRTPALQPSGIGESITSHYKWESTFERQGIVDTLASERAKLLRVNGEYPGVPSKDIADGCLLIYHPYANLADGAAETNSQGFFDSDNIPPWDTWLCFASDGPLEDHDTSYASYLISWVPPQLIELANDGLNANPEFCILWATDLDTPFTRQLKKAGLLT